ncbi:MAG: GAF domain-containing protein, partial [Chloroflexus sp.]
MSSPEWFTVIAAITDAQHLGDLECAALNALKIALPQHQVSLRWVGQGTPDPGMAVRVLGEVEQYGWLLLHPAELTPAEAEALQAIERLLVAGYERILNRSGRNSLRQRLRFEIEVLRDSDDPDLICRQFGQVLSKLIALPVNLGVVVPIRSSAWFELMAHYSAQPGDGTDLHRFWPVDTDLSSVVIRLGVPISSVAYLDDCARYNVRPHPDHQTPETAPSYWVGSPIRFAGETLGAVYVCITTTAAINEVQRQTANEAAYYIGYLLRPILLRRAVQDEQERRKAWADIVAASAHVVDPDRTLQAILDTSCRLLDVLGGGLFLFDEQQQVLVFQYASGSQSHKFVGFRLPLTYGLIGQSFASGQPIIVNDAVQDPRRSYTLDRVIGISCYNLIVV